MGDTWARGDLNTINLHFAPTANGVGANLVFQSAAPPTRFGGSGMWYFDPSLTRFSATNDPMPFAKVKGNLTYGGQSHSVEGTGYIDKQWEQSTGTRTMTAGTGQLVIMVTTL